MFSSELYRDESLGCDCHEDEDSRCDCWEPSAGRFEATTVAVVWTHIQTGGFLSVYFTLLSHLQLKAMKKVKPCRQEGHINVSIERSKLVSGRMGRGSSFPAPSSFICSVQAWVQTPPPHFSRSFASMLSALLICILRFSDLDSVYLFLWKIKGNFLSYSFSLLLGFDTWIHIYTWCSWSPLPALQL